MRVAFALIFALLISACAVSNSHIRGMMRTGVLSLEEAPKSAAHDYNVTIQSSSAAYGTDKSETRLEIVKKLLEDQCANIEIVGEDKVKLGLSTKYYDKFQYTAYVKCN